MGKLTVSGAGRATIPVVVSSVLNDNSWETISKVSQAGQAANYWNVGDTKTIVINGTVGETTFSNLSVDVFIIGFDHNSAIEGSNTIHFKIGKIDGVQVAFCDSIYDTSDNNTVNFSMNKGSQTTGGWEESRMRNTLLGNSSEPLSPLSGSLMAALPADLRAVMKAVTKYSDNTGDGSNNASYVTSTTDYLFLLAEYEYFGTKTYANRAEQNYQEQYDYYKAGNSKIHYKHNATATGADTWCRSVNASSRSNFCVIAADGRNFANLAYRSYGVAPAFAV